MEPETSDSWKTSLGSTPEVFELRLNKNGAGAARSLQPSGKWSQRTTLLFTVGTCGAFWLLVAYLL